jgi:hypothetical protein
MDELVRNIVQRTTVVFQLDESFTSQDS